MVVVSAGHVARGGERSEWMRVLLRLGFTNPVGTGGVLDVCLYLGCRGVGGVGREWVGCFDRGLEGWYYVFLSSESGLFV